MNVQHIINLGGGHQIEIGQATWNSADRSIRNRYARADGGFNVRGSSELPMNDVTPLVKTAVGKDELSLAELLDIVDACSASIRRQLP